MGHKANYSVGLALLVAASTTPAARLRVDIDTLVAPSPPTNWVAATPVPTTMAISFILDTLSFSTATYQPFTDPGNPSDPCLGSFSITGLATSAMSMQSDQGMLWSASNLSSGFGGPNASGGCPGGFFAGFGFSDAGNEFSWSFDPNPGISMAVLDASSDPLADLMLGFEGFSGTAQITGGWGTLFIGTSSSNTTITTVVPLPGSFLFFASGLLGLAWRPYVRQRRGGGRARVVSQGPPLTNNIKKAVPLRGASERVQ